MTRYLILLVILLGLGCKGEMDDFMKYCSNHQELLVRETLNHLTLNNPENAPSDVLLRRAAGISSVCCSKKCTDIALGKKNSPEPKECAHCIDRVIQDVISGKLDPLYLKMDTEKCCEGD